MSEAKVSVIIPVRNAADKIERCLTAVFSQSLQPHEVIVVDGRSTDDTVPRVQKFPVKLFFQDYGACGAARQIGVESAEGDYLAFTDADCIPSREWLRTLAAQFANGVVGVGGGIDNTGEGLWIRSINMAQNTFLGGGSSIQTRLFKKPRYVKSISASNSMYRKQDVVAAGGFNIHLSGADETELNRRLTKRLQGRLLYVPSAVVVHDHGRDLKEFARNMYHYGGWRRECGVWDAPVIPPLLAPLLLLSLIFTHWALLVSLGLYLLATVSMGFGFALKERDIRYLFSIPVVYLIEHACYIAGFWRQTIWPRRMLEIKDA